MVNTEKPKYSFYVIAPFNSEMLIDYSSLIGKYDQFRKMLCSSLQKECPDQVIIEKFSSEKSPFKRIREWMAETAEKRVQTVDELLFKGTGGSGAMKRDKSIITIQIDEKIKLPMDVIGVDLFSSDPILLVESMSFHEYGIGMLYCKVILTFKQDFLQIKPRKVMADLLDQILRTNKLLEITQFISLNVFEQYKNILDTLEVEKPLMTYNDLFGNQKSGIPLWGHIVLVRNKIEDDEILLIDEIMKKVVEISHPEGGINFAKGTSGFVHIGWGNSLWANLNETELGYAKETLRYLEIEYRTLQVFNDILYKRLNQLAHIVDYKKDGLKKQ